MHNQDSIRTILVGCGKMSNAWLTAALNISNVKIVGLVDVIEEAARAQAIAYNLTDAIVATDLETVLQQIDADAVFNCTIPEAHYTVTMQALAHGCHVLSEKPLADSLEHAREMVETAQRVGKIFAVIQNRRYDPNIRRMTSFLSSRTLGELTTVNSDFYIPAHFGGFRDHMRHVLLLDMAIHSFDAARLLTGADPVSVYCHEWNPAGSWYDQDASALAIFEMSNGLIYTYRGSWCANGLPTSWECDWRFIGQNGSAVWDGGSRTQAQVVESLNGFSPTYRTVEIPAHPNDNVGGHAGIISEFFDCIKHGTQPETSAADNIKSLAMVFGAIKSAETGQKTMITER